MVPYGRSYGLCPFLTTKKKILWRALHDILRTKENLRRRKILQDPSCPVCGLEPETISHILWQCQSTRDVWSLGNRALQKSAIYEGNFGEVFENLLRRCSQDEMVQVAGLARRIWLRRYDVVFGGKLTSPQSLLKRTDQVITDFKLA